MEMAAASSSVTNIPYFKIVVLGDGGVGKTVFVQKHRKGEFELKYIATMGAEVSPIHFQTSQGEVRLNMWDCAGQPRFSGLCDGYYIKADAAIIMFDVTGTSTYESLDTWYKSLRSVRGCENIPVVICGNKVDCKDRKVKPADITFHRENKLQYYDISVKSGFAFNKPFEYLLRRLAGDANLTITQAQE